MGAEGDTCQAGQLVRQQGSNKPWVRVQGLDSFHDLGSPRFILSRSFRVPTSFQQRVNRSEKPLTQLDFVAICELRGAGRRRETHVLHEATSEALNSLATRLLRPASSDVPTHAKASSMLHLGMFSICRSVPHHFRGNLVEGRTWEVAHFVSQLVQERGIDRRQNTCWLVVAGAKTAENDFSRASEFRVPEQQTMTAGKAGKLRLSGFLPLMAPGDPHNALSKGHQKVSPDVIGGRLSFPGGWVDSSGGSLDFKGRWLDGGGGSLEYKGERVKFEGGWLDSVGGSLEYKGRRVKFEGGWLDSIGDSLEFKGGWLELEGRWLNGGVDWLEVIGGWPEFEAGLLDVEGGGSFSLVIRALGFLTVVILGGSEELEGGSNTTGKRSLEMSSTSLRLILSPSSNAQRLKNSRKPLKKQACHFCRPLETNQGKCGHAVCFWLQQSGTAEHTMVACVALANGWTTSAARTLDDAGMRAQTG
ncbi:hypothetical protein C0Q70_00896 [Pomacea canaliculata]|uniref:Uncharacterized protein n=1 Tax=Pomacea canaliculata TaxID=400727 RepID=A0A2T7PXY0_POMCA|nr:hypothetical protein C0Q70_00896 [Pomacea canaliculata]